MTKKDKDSLILLGVLIAIITFIVVVYYSTRYLDFRIIIGIFAILSIISCGMIITRYTELYGVSLGFPGWIPILNGIFAYPRSLAMILVVMIAMIITVGVFAALPADVYLTIMSEITAMRAKDRMVVLLLLLCNMLYVLYTVGLCMIMHDVKLMLTEATGLKRPGLESVNYVLLFIPLIAVASYGVLLSQINQLKNFNYSVGEVEKQNNKYSEV